MNFKVEHNTEKHTVSLHLEVDVVENSEDARNWDIDDAIKILSKEGYNFTWKDVLVAESAVNNRGSEEAKGLWTFRLSTAAAAPPKKQPAKSAKSAKPAKAPAKTSTEPAETKTTARKRATKATAKSTKTK